VTEAVMRVVSRLPTGRSRAAHKALIEKCCQTKRITMDALARAATLFGLIFLSSPVLAILWICAVYMAISSAVRISSLLRQDWKPKPEATGQSPQLVRILAAPRYRKHLDQLFWSSVVAVGGVAAVVWLGYSLQKIGGP